MWNRHKIEECNKRKQHKVNNIQQLCLAFTLALLALHCLIVSINC